MALEGSYTPIGAPQQSLNGTGTVVKTGYRNWVPSADDALDVRFWEDYLPYTRLEKEKEIVLGPDTKLKQLGVDSVQITEGLKGYKAGEKTLTFKQKGCYLATFDFKDKAGMRKAIAMLQDIKNAGKKFSIDQLAYILKNFRK